MLGVVATTNASGAMAGRSSEGTDAVPAGSFAAESTKQQRRGVIGARGAFGQCSMQQTMARSSAIEARGAATVMRAAMPTASRSTQVVRRFRDTACHCMSGICEWQPTHGPGGDEMEINGIAHTMLTVSNFAACQDFYKKLLPFLGLRPVFDTDGFLYCVGGRTAFGIQRADDAYRNERFVQNRIGLHHVCFRARERADVDELHRFLVEMGATIVHPPEDGQWAPGYYSVLFEDPDGVRLEMNHVPGKGLLQQT
jgi:catechol 2,3-dioxygenase-like lactoylglutathione lyase family enzyme